MRYDSIVIGSGAAGLYYALASAKKGKRVALIEKEKIGGTAFSTGCLPVKQLMDKIREIEKARGLEREGYLSVTVTADEVFKGFKATLKATKSHIEARLKESGVDLFEGSAVILEAGKIRVNHQILEGENLIVATGTSPAGIGNIIPDGEWILTHGDVFELETLPREIVIIGGNVEGIEFASMLCELGVKVILVEKQGRVLEGYDEDLIEGIIKRLELKGVQIVLNCEVVAVHTETEGVTVETKGSSSITSIKVEKVLLTGIRKGNIPEGIEALGALLNQGYLEVDKNLMTGIEGIYAIGDVNGVHGMAHVAIQQGIQLSEHLWRNAPITMNYKSLPRCIFTLNELAGAGIQVGVDVDTVVKKIELNKMFRGVGKSENQGFMKVIFKSGIIKGVWVYGPDASALVGSIGLWIDREVSADEIRRHLFINPTYSEGLIEAIL